MKKKARKSIKSSEHKKTQKEIEIARKYIDDIINLNPYSIQICDKDGYHIRANQAFMDLFKTFPPPEWSILNDPILKKAGHQELIHKVKSGKVVELPETWYNPHDLSPKLPDKRVCLSSVIFSILNPDEEVENIVIMHNDITELKKVEEKLKERVDRAERFHKVTVDRELRMVELKQEINSLLEKLGQSRKYEVT
ncbi:PAS domain-containing protein [bacterium]|nr:PAS domain-containing protein [bacterium]